MIISVVLRGIAALLILCLGALIAGRLVAPDRLFAISGQFVPVRHQVETLLHSAGEDRETGAQRGQTMERGRTLASVHPLDPLPYTLLQFEGAADGDEMTANRAALTALSFQPRNRAARMHVVNQLLARGAYDEAMAQITLLYRIDPTGRNIYHTALVGLGQNPTAAPALERAVALDPPWKERVVLDLSQTTADRAFVQRLFEHLPERIDVLLKRMISEGDMDAAYLTFLTSLPSDVAITIPFDPSFSGLAGSPPFNWRVNDRYAELSETGGLDISYFGRGSILMARQVFPLTTGAYQLETRFEGVLDPEAATFGIRIHCIDGEKTGPRIGEWTFEPEAINGGQAINQFVHDQSTGCAYAALTLRAFPGGYPATSRLKVLGFTLSSVEQDAS